MHSQIIYYLILVIPIALFLYVFSLFFAFLTRRQNINAQNLEK